MGKYGRDTLISKVTRGSIAVRLVFWFLIISILPLTAVLLINFQISRKTLTHALRDHLLAIADAKVDQIAFLASEKNKDVTTLSHQPLILDALVATGNSSKSDPETVEQHRPFLQTYANAYGYDDLLLISNSGDIVFCLRCGFQSSNVYQLGENKDLAGVFDRAKTLLETEFSDFRVNEATGIASAYIAAPVFSGGTSLGVVALQMNNRTITNIVEDYTGLGETGETILGTSFGDQVIFVTPSRHDSSAAFQRRLSSKRDAAVPIVRATEGNRGDGIEGDYRGTEVMAVWRYLPYFRWGIVVKMDTHEFFAPLIFQRNLMLFFGIVLLLLVILSALFVAESVSGPVRKLTAVSKQVAAGDLMAQIDSPQNSQDEVSILARGFSTMTSNLLGLIRGVKESGSALTSSTSQIAAASRQLEATVNEQAASTNEVVATTKQISTTSQNLVQTITNVAEEAGRTSSMVESGRKGLDEMEIAMQRLVEATELISARLQKLNEKAAGINSVVTTINRVADQTNLLSMNAAIEAEKAGEAGLGFGVVAAEIRRLADQTGYATMDIAQIVKEMQGAVDTGVENMKEFTSRFQTEVQKLRQVARELNSTIENVQALAPRYEQVRQGILSQSIAAEQISEAMVHLNDAAQYTAESVRALNHIAGQLNEASNHLQHEVQRFKVTDGNET